MFRTMRIIFTVLVWFGLAFAFTEFVADELSSWRTGPHTNEASVALIGG